MVYTLSSPTVLAGDAACHPFSAELLAALSETFRLTERGVTHLGLCALDADPDATALAWGMVELVDGTAATTSDVLRSAVTGGLPQAATLARTRLGDVRDVTRLVVAEAARWPDPVRVGVAGGRRAAASAAAAAGAVDAWWARPDLPEEHAQVLIGPWVDMIASGAEHLAPRDESYGPRGGAVVELCEAVGSGTFSLAGLAEVTWPFGVWARAMHAGAWAAHTSGRLRAQLVAVLDVTAALLRSLVDPDPVLVRAALPALHALTVAALVDDVLDRSSLRELRLGGVAL